LEAEVLTVIVGTVVGTEGRKPGPAAPASPVRFRSIKPTAEAHKGHPAGRNRVFVVRARLDTTKSADQTPITDR